MRRRGWTARFRLPWSSGACGGRRGSGGWCSPGSDSPGRELGGPDVEPGRWCGSCGPHRAACRGGPPRWRPRPHRSPAAEPSRPPGRGRRRARSAPRRRWPVRRYPRAQSPGGGRLRGRRWDRWPGTTRPWTPRRRLGAGRGRAVPRVSGTRKLREQERTFPRKRLYLLLRLLPMPFAPGHPVQA